jgi:hypothetical protein
MDLFNGRHPVAVIPSKDGTHLSTSAAADKWVPAFAGMTEHFGNKDIFLDTHSESRGGRSTACRLRWRKAALIRFNMGQTLL